MPTDPTAPAARLYKERFRIKNITFRNRVLRAPMGGKFAYFDGSVNEAWKHFERWFAYHGVGGIISTTMAVDENRFSPLEYPTLAHDRFIEPLGRAIATIKATGGCPYIVQVGDPGSATQGSLFSQPEDGKSASSGFNFLYGYRTWYTEMTLAEVRRVVDQHAAAAARAKKAGADGIEICASKEYILHQFLNPGVNRRNDDYGGSLENRFRLLGEVMRAVREAVGPEMAVGVRLSAIDYNYLPTNLRFPPARPLRQWLTGNTLKESTHYAQEIERLSADYLHITRGFGFVNPKESAGDYPLEQIRLFVNSVRHLSAKADTRATILNAVPDVILKAILGAGWHKDPGGGAEAAGAIKKAVKIPVIANGGFQSRDLIEKVLAEGKCDLVSVARPLLANPDLLAQFEERPEPKNPCTFCNRCSVITAVYPLGCYEPRRFTSQEEMEQQILQWSRDPQISDQDETTAGDDPF